MHARIDGKQRPLHALACWGKKERERDDPERPVVQRAVKDTTRSSTRHRSAAMERRSFLCICVSVCLFVCLSVCLFVNSCPSMVAASASLSLNHHNQWLPLSSRSLLLILSLPPTRIFSLLVSPLSSHHLSLHLFFSSFPSTSLHLFTSLVLVHLQLPS